jgi:hypothetical protein
MPPFQNLHGVRLLNESDDGGSGGAAAEAKLVPVPLAIMGNGGCG